MLKREDIYFREPKRPLTSDILTSAWNYPGINENEGGFRIEKLRDSTVKVDPASSHKLGVELPNSEDFL
ncbi:hypothetical protein TNCV_4420321 [Trichonephila clavipes]|nr:hypothetical protein TNCV_4420321 [Trichonephila clavipes]